MKKSGIIDRFLKYVKSLENSAFSPRQMEIKAGLSNGVIGNWYAEGKSLPSTHSIEKFLKAFPGLNSEWLLLGKGEMLERETKGIEIGEQPTAYLSGKDTRFVTVTVDRQKKDLITFVPVKAYAGYTKGYFDSEFMGTLPAYNIPLFKDGAYRMFEVKGDSMLQLGGGGLHDGDVVIGQYVEDIFSIRDNRVYVIVHTGGVWVKRCLNRLKPKADSAITPAIICKSDNKNGYNDEVLRADEIIEVWELKAFISKQLSFSTDLWEVIGDLQAQQAQLKDKVDKMEKKQLMP